MPSEHRQALDTLLREAPFDLGGDLTEQRKIFIDMISAHPLPDDVATEEAVVAGVPVIRARTPQRATTDRNGKRLLRFRRSFWHPTGSGLSERDGTLAGMTMIRAIEAVLKANDPEGEPGYLGEFTLAGRLLSRGQIAVCGLDGGDYFAFDDLADGLHEVYLAYDWDDERGAAVSAVALVASGATPETLVGASWEEASDDVNQLSEEASAIYSSTPDNLVIGGALRRTAGFTEAEDPTARAVAEFEAQQEAGSRTPVLDVVVDPASGANALVFPTCDFSSNSILVGRDGNGTGVGIFWSNFDG